MGNKTIGIEEDVHIKLTEIQLNLRKIKIERTLRQLHDIAIRHGIDSVFEIVKNEEIVRTPTMQSHPNCQSDMLIID